ncbi:hypothetical protein [Pseudomonas fluorescens]|uniref:hypothetical protein n=1 Tax=Pseudomonas fluorescens TaxID=294 RepID=UPI000642662D|nr:hypothetical protein [Pseudomonas fluorescens]
MDDLDQSKPDRDSLNGPHRSAQDKSDYDELKHDNERIARKIEEIWKAQLDKERLVNSAEKEADAFARNEDLRKNFIVNRVRPVLLFAGMMMLVASSVFLVDPEFFRMLTNNSFATTLGVSGVLLTILSVLLGYFGSVRERTFVDIDDRLYGARVAAVEAEKELLEEKIRQLENEKFSNFTVRQFVPSSAFESADLLDKKHDSGSPASVGDKITFDSYMKSLIRALDMNIEIADSKASLLLDKGTNYLWRGIVFYVISIVVWQVATINFKVGDFAIWGMISCSMTFLVVEFLAAWFLRQYKSFTDSSFNLVRVKSIFNRYFLSYLAIREFSDSSQHLVDMREQMLKVLDGDIKWLEPASQKAGELNHMIAMFESVSGLVEKLKVTSKSDNSTASS